MSKPEACQPPEPRAVLDALRRAEDFDGAGGADRVAVGSSDADDAVQAFPDRGLDPREPGAVGAAEDDAARADDVTDACGRAGDVVDQEAVRHRDAGAVLPGGGVAAHVASVAKGAGIVDRV